MATFYLEIDALGSYTGGNAPLLEVLVGGVVVSSSSVSTSSATYAFNIDYTGNYPSSLSLRFNGSSGDSGDTITVEAVRFSGQTVDTSNLSTLLLTQGASSTVNVVNTDHLYGRTEPTSGDLGTVTVNGTSGNDVLLGGTAEGDVIDAGGGDDRVRGIAADDAIFGGSGRDRIFGEAGNDIILGEAGNDILFGNDGDDLIYGGADNDRIIGGDGVDTLNGGTGNDGILGGAGNDIIFGEAGNDFISGGADDDIIYGDGGNDKLDGGSGADIIFGGDNDDLIDGGSGADQLDGGAGADVIYGEAGDDIIDGEAGNDDIWGGTGADTINGQANDDTIHGGDDGDILDGGAGADVVIGGAGADTITGDTGNDILHGHGLDSAEIGSILAANPNVVYSSASGSFYQFVSANVSFSAAQSAAAASSLNGVAGHLATITSDAENSFIQSIISDNSWHSGTDEVSNTDWIWSAGLESGMQFSSGGTAVNSMYESWDSGQPQNNTEHNAVIYSSNGSWHDWVDTSTHSYVIEWEAGLMGDDGAIDTISGGDGDDMIYGYDGDDILDGGNNADIILGGDGSDTITGGSGNDVLYAYDATVENAGALVGGGTVTLVDESFTGSTGSVFSYTDGGFGGSDGANVSVTGSYDTDGNAAGGSLEVFVDGQNNSSFTNGSGSWDASISHTANLTNVQITFSYRHWHPTWNDTNEDSQVWLEFDGTTYDASGGNSFISEALGSAGTTDTGWVTVTVDLPDLTASSTYNLSLGILHTGSSRSNEDALVRFDDITITGDEAGSAGTTTNTADIGETNNVSGGAGDDILYGSSGTDILDGGADNDTIYSASANEAWDALVASILSSNSGVSYSEDTNSFYQYVSTAATFTNADNAATSATLTGLSGVTGHLATITSQAEQDYVWSLGGGNSLWGGANDTSTEGTWVWQGGDDNGLQFWSGGAAGSGGSTTNSHFENWIPDGSEPWGNSADYDYFILRSANGGQWWTENNDASTFDYVIEWDAGSLLTSVDYTTIYGGSGTDTLYANDGIDIFMFETATWDATDTIEGFSASGRDAIDISDLLTGYTYTGSDINDFVQLSEASGNTTISVDANGATSGASFTDVAVLNGVTGLDLYQMIAADNLVVS